MTTLTALPSAPSRADPTNFSARGDALMTALETVFVPQMNTVIGELNTLATGITSSVGTASAAATTATTQAAAAAASAAQAAASAAADAVLWVSGNNYTAGTLQYSPINGATYRRFITGATTTDPSLDTINYRTITRIDGVGTIQMLSSTNTANGMTFPNGSQFLKTGVMVTRTAALAANYDVATLESTGWSSVMSYANSTGISTNALAFGASKYVVVGTGGSIKYSSDGATWSTATSGTAVDLIVVKFINSLFVVIGNGVLLSSPDGITWTTKTNPVAGVPKDIEFISGLYVVSISTTPYHSPDLTTWTVNSVYSGNFILGNGKAIGICGGSTARVCLFDLTTYEYSSPHILTGSASIAIAYANGMYFAMYAAGTAQGAYSSDGISWSAMTTPPAVLSSVQSKYSKIVYGNSIYVAACNTSDKVMSSTDGITWTLRTSNTTNAYTGIIFLNGIFFNYYGQPGGGGLTNVATSTDGITWTARTITQGCAAMAYGAGVYVTVGGNGSSINTINSSADGFTWTNRVNATTGSSTGLRDIAFNGSNMFVAVGDVGDIYSSPDGITWTLRTSSIGAVDLYSVHYLNGQFIISSANQMMYSSNGTSWTTMTITASQGGYSPVWRYAYYFNSKWVYLPSGNQAVVASTSTLSSLTYLNLATSFTPDKIANSGTRLVAMYNGSTNGNSSMYSKDGIYWTPVVKPTAFATTDIPVALTYGGGNFVAMKDTRIWYSSTGLDWSTSPATITGAGTGQAIVYGGSTWFVTGSTANATSTNLTTWTTRSRGPSNYSPTLLTYGAGNFVGAVSSNTIVTPDGISGGIGAGAAVSISNVSTYLQVS